MAAASTLVVYARFSTIFQESAGFWPGHDPHGIRKCCLPC